MASKHNLISVFITKACDLSEYGNILDIKDEGQSASVAGFLVFLIAWFSLVMINLFIFRFAFLLPGGDAFPVIGWELLFAFVIGIVAGYIIRRIQLERAYR